MAAARWPARRWGKPRAPPVRRPQSRAGGQPLRCAVRRPGAHGGSPDGHGGCDGPACTVVLDYSLGSRGRPRRGVQRPRKAFPPWQRGVAAAAWDAPGIPGTVGSVPESGPLGGAARITPTGGFITKYMVACWPARCATTSRLHDRQTPRAALHPAAAPPSRKWMRPVDGPSAAVVPAAAAVQGAGVCASDRWCLQRSPVGGRADGAHPSAPTPLPPPVPLPHLSPWWPSGEWRR